MYQENVYRNTENSTIFNFKSVRKHMATSTYRASTKRIRIHGIRHPHTFIRHRCFDSIHINYLWEKVWISSPKPACVTLIQRKGQRTLWRIQIRIHKILVPVPLRLREVVFPFDQQKLPRKFCVARTLVHTLPWRSFSLRDLWLVDQVIWKDSSWRPQKY